VAVWRPSAPRFARRPIAPRPRRGGGPAPAPAPAPDPGTIGGALSAVPAWQGRLALLAACTLPGVLTRIGGAPLPPVLAMLAFGGAVTAAAFMLAAAAEVAELDVPAGIAVAGIAFVAVLPEYVIEVYFAYSGQVEYVAASLTGSTRLLLSFAVGMPAVASLVLAARGRPPVETVELSPRRRVDLAVIAAASLYAPVIVIRGHIAWPDSLVLIGLYGLYLRRTGTGTPEPPHLVGVAARLGALPTRGRRRWVAGLMLYSAATVLVTAEPFANAALLTGQTVGVSPYMLVQWLVPLATEMPELVIALVLILHARAGQAVAVLLSSAVSQWTLALGSLPLAYLAGAGQGPLPLLGRERIELLLTSGQGLLAVAVLVTLRQDTRDAVLMLTLFAVQAAIPSVAIRAALTVGYLVLAVDIASSRRWAIPALARALRARPESAPP
jgi:cation:H+ antiporter